ncbi:type II toxin-antitoxin system RelE family toxin [Scytonema sp. NUACC26]|uniref:type II toxin-antitoxin system RelE family toxin n=1 Tax=Scytonema sp. NUACC26 TaxID=3140176 RepID=UPI0034DC8F32
MSYEVKLTSTALEQIKKLDSETQRRTAMKLQELAVNPHLSEAKNLDNADFLYKISLDDYRIVYQIEDEFSLVTIVKIAHLRDY